MFEDGGYNLAKDLGVALQQLQPGLRRLLPNPRTKQDHTAPGQVVVTTRPDFQGMSKRYGMLDVVGFGNCPGGVLVHQHKLANDAAHHTGHTREGASEPPTDNDDS